MITTNHSGNMVSVTVFGEFTLEDYKEFEELVNYKVKFEGPVNLFFDLRQMAGFTFDVAWEEIQFSRKHSHDFGRISVVTEDQWITWSAWISQIFVDAGDKPRKDVQNPECWITHPQEDQHCRNLGKCPGDGDDAAGKFSSAKGPVQHQCGKQSDRNGSDNDKEHVDEGDPHREPEILIGKESFVVLKTNPFNISGTNDIV